MMKGLGLVSLVALLVSACSGVALESSDSTEANVPRANSPFVGGGSIADDNWVTFGTGLLGESSVAVEHGGLGFLLVEYVERGAVVWVSRDGTDWAETSVLEGPEGREQLKVERIIITDEEYIVLADTWSNEPDGPEEYRSVVFRSADGVTWTQALTEPREANSVDMALTDDGLVVVGALVTDDPNTVTPAIWLEDDELGFVEVSFSIPGLGKVNFLESVSAGEHGVLIAGLLEGDMYIWETDDFSTWTENIAVGSGFLYSFLRTDDRWTAVSPHGVWTSVPSEGWEQVADREAFSTDAVSPGVVQLGELVQLGEYVASVSSVGYRYGSAWCYEDPLDCGQRELTVLVSSDGHDWRRIDLPGGRLSQPYPEGQGFSVNGQLGVAYTLRGELVISVLSSARESSPLGNGTSPDLPFQVVEGSDNIEFGVEYGYASGTHCGISLGELNGHHWITSYYSESIRDLQGWGQTVYGFVTMVEDGVVQYRLGDQVVATFIPDPAYEELSCE